MTCSLVWFRQDLRLADNPALSAAAKRGAPVVALYVLDEETPGQWKPGGARKWWLHYSLEALTASLGEHDIELILRRGKAEMIVPQIVETVKAEAVFWNRCYEPFAIERDKTLKQTLQKQSIEVESFSGSLLHEPWTVKTGSDTPFKVFTPFWRAARALPVEPPLPVPKNLIGRKVSHGDRLKDWNLLPIHPDWAGGIAKFWKPGEAEAKKRFNQFTDEAMQAYAAHRDEPARDDTSRLSPYLHHGEISPRQIWHALHTAHEAGRNVDKFLSELGWREFSYNILFNFPKLPTEPFNERFATFPWRQNKKFLQAWQKGQTGYPLIDAGMRQLWELGWMHNRVRLATASFLIKHLGISWQEGAAWFWDTLVDADLANNSASWQWVAGSGADAAPYYRIFNPILQSQKFDPAGTYIRRFVPELKDLPDDVIHTPWEAPEEVLTKAGIVLGKTYPLPIVDHAQAREAALAAFKGLKPA